MAVYMLSVMCNVTKSHHDFNSWSENDRIVKFNQILMNSNSRKNHQDIFPVCFKIIKELYFVRKKKFRNPSDKNSTVGSIKATGHSALNITEKLIALKVSFKMLTTLFSLSL